MSINNVHPCSNVQHFDTIVYKKMFAAISIFVKRVTDLSDSPNYFTRGKIKNPILPNVLTG